MAATYSYDDFLKAAQENSWGEGNGFSSADWRLAQQNPDAGMSILNAKRDYINATTSEQRAEANKRAEAIRSAYGGYTGGTDGAGYYLNQPSPQQFSYQQAPTLSYDPDTDPVTQAYMKRYAREGNRATQNALGSAAAMTGGIPSSYAVAAASQAGDYYAAQAADKIPELYQQAYNRYVNDLNQWNTDRNFAYGQYLDEINAQTQNRQEALQKAELGYQVGDNRLLEEMGYNLENDPAAWARRQQEQQYATQLGISLGDYRPAQEYYGVTADQQMLNADMLYNLAVLRLNQGDPSLMNQLIEKYFPGAGGAIPTNTDETYSGGSGGGSSGGTKKSSDLTSANTNLGVAAARQAAGATQNVLNAIAQANRTNAANSVASGAQAGLNLGVSTYYQQALQKAIERMKELEKDDK